MDTVSLIVGARPQLWTLRLAQIEFALALSRRRVRPLLHTSLNYEREYLLRELRESLDDQGASPGSPVARSTAPY